MRDEQEVMLCPSCAAPNRPRADFCEKCGAPIGSLTMTDPIKRLYGTGWAYRRISTAPPSPIVVWGSLLLFLPTCVAATWMLFETLNKAVSPGGWFAFPRGSLLSAIADTLHDLIVAGIVVIYAVILYRVISHYLQSRK